ncbi:SAM-dependent methlyltransferase [Balamuthia mandrillaris]
MRGSATVKWRPAPVLWVVLLLGLLSLFLFFELKRREDRMEGILRRQMQGGPSLQQQKREEDHSLVEASVHQLQKQFENLASEVSTFRRQVYDEVQQQQQHKQEEDNCQVEATILKLQKQFENLESAVTTLQRLMQQEAQQQQAGHQNVQSTLVELQKQVRKLEATIESHQDMISSHAAIPHSVATPASQSNSDSFCTATPEKDLHNAGVWRPMDWSKLSLPVPANPSAYNRAFVGFCSPFMYAFVQRGFHFCHYDPKKDIYISKAIASGSFFEQNELFTVTHGIPKQGIVFDVGANIGIWTMWLGARGNLVYSFEPIQDSFSLLTRSVAMNGLTERVHCYNNALGDRNAITRIEVNQNNRGGSFIRDLLGFVPEQNISLVTLDGLLPELERKHGSNFEVELMKVDVEGYEGRFLLGASQFMARHTPKVIFMEITPNSLQAVGCNALNMLEYLVTTLGYFPHSDRLQLIPDLKAWVSSIGGLRNIVLSQNPLEPGL